MRSTAGFVPCYSNSASPPKPMLAPYGERRRSIAHYERRAWSFTDSRRRKAHSIGTTYGHGVHFDHDPFACTDERSLFAP
jgi:hypothetical protein